MAATKKEKIFPIFNQSISLYDQHGHHHIIIRIFTFIFKAADDIGGGHGSVVISETVVELHHVLRRLFTCASKRHGRRTQARQVESPQKLFLQALQQALHVHVAVLLQQ